jgi:heavy metal sensor kinase
MRSISLSLILCILVLLVASLITVSALAYREAEISHCQKRESRRQSLEAEYAQNLRVEAKELDESLLGDARSIASSVGVKIEYPDKKIHGISSLGVLSTANLPQGHLFVPLWAANWAHPGIRPFVSAGVSFKLFEIRIPPEIENNPSRYYQINSLTGDEWRSPSLHEHSLPQVDPKVFKNREKPKDRPLTDWVFETTTIQVGGKETTVRLVRAQFKRFPVQYGWYKGPKGKSSPLSGKDKTPPPPGPAMSIYVQAAADLAPLNAAVAAYGAELERKLAELESNTDTTLETLRNRFILISAVTLLVAVAMGCLLVSWGLRPMRRLSDAVSKVSEKDFRLPIDESRLPNELQPVAARLAQTLDQLRRAFTREKQAAADISHELRTPLAAMLATIDVALRKPRRAEEYHEVLEECREAAQQISQLVERMLALARLDAGVDNLRPSEVDVGKRADQCGSLVRPLAEARGVSLHVERNGPASIKADPDKLREVLTNLLHNAIEYNKPDGSIDVSVRRDNGALVLRVRDTGIGIAPEARDRIFERFFREDPSRQADGLHAGIGLALVKGYVDLMGGEITVDSAVGEGSTFTVRLPADETTSP